MRNSVYLVGRLGNDPELKDLDGGNKLVKFSLATNEFYKTKKGESVEKTDWHRIVGFGPMAENMDKILKKGSMVAIQGKIEYQKYTDKEGVEKYSTDIKAFDFVAMSPATAAV